MSVPPVMSVSPRHSSNPDSIDPLTDLLRWWARQDELTARSREGEGGLEHSIAALNSEVTDEPLGDPKCGGLAVET